MKVLLLNFVLTSKDLEDPVVDLENSNTQLQNHQEGIVHMPYNLVNIQFQSQIIMMISIHIVINQIKVIIM